MTPLALRRRLYRLCHVQWPTITAWYDTWQDDRSSQYVNVGERKSTIRDAEVSAELDRQSKILRVSGQQPQTVRRAGLLGKERA